MGCGFWGPVTWVALVLGPGYVGDMGFAAQSRGFWGLPMRVTWGFGSSYVGCVGFWGPATRVAWGLGSNYDGCMGFGGSYVGFLGFGGQLRGFWGLDSWDTWVLGPTWVHYTN